MPEKVVGARCERPCGCSHMLREHRCSPMLRRIDFIQRCSLWVRRAWGQDQRQRAQLELLPRLWARETRRIWQIWMMFRRWKPVLSDDWIWREKLCQCVFTQNLQSESPWGEAPTGLGIAPFRCWFVTHRSSSRTESGGRPWVGRLGSGLSSHLWHRLQMSFLPGILIC